MTTFNQEAKQRLEQYLRQVHLALTGCQSMSADDVERDIREHIEHEFQATSDVISLGQLNPILVRLGSPMQWVPQAELPWWRRFLLRLRQGPEDWRLAYFTLVLLVVGCLFGPPLLWYVIPTTYLMARAALAVARERNETLGAQRWFLYPPLLVVGGILLFILVFGPIFWATVIGEPLLWQQTASGAETSWRGPPDLSNAPPERLRHVAAVVLSASAIWWTLLGGALCAWPGFVRAVFRPFADNFGRRHALVIVCLGIGLGILFGAAMAMGLLR
jgi:hypothetical protein